MNLSSVRHVWKNSFGRKLRCDMYTMAKPQTRSGFNIKIIIKKNNHNSSHVNLIYMSGEAKIG